MIFSACFPPKSLNLRKSLFALFTGMGTGTGTGTGCGIEGIFPIYNTETISFNCAIIVLTKKNVQNTTNRPGEN